jgi:short-subunit dehydrogenase
MQRDLKGKRILITGASSGIGRCVAEQLAAKGARLALVGRSADRLQDLAANLSAAGTDAIAIAGDVTVEEDRQRMVRATVEKFGGLDVLINNAGVASWAHFADSSEEILRQIMEVNFFAPAELIRIAIPELTRGQQPAILNVGSMCGRRGMPAWPEYSASKFGLCGLTEALRGEMARFGIDVLLVLPGLTRSSLQEHMLLCRGKEKIDFKAGMDPAIVAQGIVDALAKNRTETVLGREARWMLRVNRYAPRLVDWLIGRRVQKLYATGIRQ